MTYHSHARSLRGSTEFTGMIDVVSFFPYPSERKRKMNPPKTVEAQAHVHTATCGHAYTPPREPNEHDLQRIRDAEAKRARKAAKRRS